MKWITEKKGRWVYLLVFAAIVCILGGLIVSIAGNISVPLGRMKLPKGEVKELPLSPPNLELSYSASYMPCSTYPYQVRVPETTEQKGGMLVGEKDGISYVIAEAEGSLEDMIQDILPRVINQPVLGFVPKYENAVSRDGYLYDKKASYRAGKIQTKVSVRCVTEYTCAYMLYLDRGRNLVVYASVQQSELIKEAEELIRQIAVSTEHYGTVPGEGHMNHNIAEEEESKEMDFSIDVKNDYFLAEGICIFHWTNISEVPGEIVLCENGKEISFVEELYSVPGEYVFVIGKCEPKTYQMKGTVGKPLQNVWVNFQELEDYIGYKQSEEDPEFWIPRKPD